MAKEVGRYTMNINKKKKNDDLILIADKALNETGVLFKDAAKKIIFDSYNGQIAALPVSIAMTGLKPALAIYYQDKKDQDNKEKANRRAILTVIAKMITLDTTYEGAFTDADALYKGVVQMEEWRKIKTEIINCSIALKQVVRTYSLEKS